MTPTTRYAKSGAVSIAYQVVGEGPPDLVLVPGFVSHVEAAWTWPYLARFYRRLASFSRLIVFDKRGTGLSDPMKRPPTMKERMDDIRAVMDAVEVRSAPLLGVSEGGALAMLFAAKHRDRAKSLILYGSYAKKIRSDDYPWGVSRDQLDTFMDSFDAAWATGAWWDVVNPDAEADASSREAWARYLRAAASPGMARDLLQMNSRIDVRTMVPTIDVPTLVIHRRDDRWVDAGNGRFLAEAIPRAQLVELPGKDHRPWLDDADAVLNEIELFVTGARRRPHPRAKLGSESLSRREREVIDLALEGESTPEMAARLFLSERTIESHLASAYTKLGVHSRVELLRRAGELGL